MSFQISLLRRGVVTLNTFVLLLVAMCFYMSIKITNRGWFIITLAAFLSHFQVNLKILRRSYCHCSKQSPFRIVAYTNIQCWSTTFTISWTFTFSTHLLRKKVKVLFIPEIIVLMMTLSNWVGGIGIQGNPILWKKMAIALSETIQCMDVGALHFYWHRSQKDRFRKGHH